MMDTGKCSETRNTQNNKNRKKGNKTKHIKLMVTSLLLGLIFFLGACAPKELPEGFDEANVTSIAKEVIVQMSEGDFEAVVEQFTPEMKKALDAKALEDSVGGILKDLGEFKGHKKVSTTSSKNEEIGEFAVVIITSTYENGNATYTISVDKNDQIVGLYLK